MAFGSFSSPYNCVASRTSAFIDGVVHVSVSCDAVVSLTQASYVHETAYTCASSGSYVASASQGIEITNTPTGYRVSFGMPPSVLNATVNRTAQAARAAEVTSGDVVTYTCDEGTTDGGVFDGNTLFSITCADRFHQTL